MASCAGFHASALSRWLCGGSAALAGGGVLTDSARRIRFRFYQVQMLTIANRPVRTNAAYQFEILPPFATCRYEKWQYSPTGYEAAHAQIHICASFKRQIGEEPP